MVLLSHILLLVISSSCSCSSLLIMIQGVAVVFAVPTPGSSLSEGVLSVNSQVGSVLERDAAAFDTLNLDPTNKNLEFRQNRGRMTLQYSPQGRFLFLLGIELSKAMIDAHSSAGPAGIARTVLQNFLDWLDAQAKARENLVYALVMMDISDALVGGVYGKGAGDEDLGNLFGFGIQIKFVGGNNIDDIRKAIINWAQQGGAVVQNIARPNGFFDPNRIGAGGAKKRDLGERSRGDQCPPNQDLLQYATIDVPDVDINRDIRWGGKC